jgi:cleavage and polyadenylation specificity factor subunit 1
MIILSPRLLFCMKQFRHGQGKDNQFFLFFSRLATKQDTKSVAVVSIDTVNRNFTVLYTVSRLPYNSFKLIPVPSPVGGFLVLSPNGLIHVDQNSIPGVSLGLNKYFGAEAELAIHSPGPNPLYHAPNLTDETNRGLTLESSQAFFLNPDLLLFVLSNGDVMTIQLMGSDDFGAGWKRKNHGVKRFLLEILPIKTPSLLSACRLGLGAIATDKKVARVLGGLGSISSQEVAYGYAFLASKHSDGILLKFEERYEVVDYSEQPNKKSKIDEEIDDFDEIYGTNMSTNDQDTTLKNRVISLRISDSLTNIGTIKDMAMGQPVNTSQFYYTPSVPHPELDIVTLSGKDSFGSLNVLQRNLRPLILQSFDMPNVDNVWAISVQNKGSRKQYLFVNSNRRTEVYDATTTDIVEVADQFFSRDRGSVHVAAISDSHVLQVTVKNVILFNQGKF